MAEQHHSRRDLLKKAAYTAPLIITLVAAPHFASAGSSSRWEKLSTNKQSNTQFKVPFTDSSVANISPHKPLTNQGKKWWP